MITTSQISTGYYLYEFLLIDFVYWSCVLHISIPLYFWPTVTMNPLQLRLKICMHTYCMEGPLPIADLPSLPLPLYSWAEFRINLNLIKIQSKHILIAYQVYEKYSTCILRWWTIPTVSYITHRLLHTFSYVHVMYTLLYPQFTSILAWWLKQWCD